jgi:hypothetical protein
MLRHESGRMPPSRPDVIALLDAFQAAERAGAEAVGGWAARCRDPRLRGGLRVICARDRRHAGLAEARLRALGGVPSASVGRELTALCALITDAEVSDRSKLAMLLARVPGCDPLADLVRRVEGDPETHALLQTIGDDEQASLGWLQQMRESLEREDA